MTKKLPDFLEDTLAASASPHMNPAQTNDAMIMMELFGAPKLESCAVQNCEFETAWCRPKVHCRIYSKTAGLHKV